MTFFDGTNVDESAMDNIGPVPSGSYVVQAVSCDYAQGKNDPMVGMFKINFQVLKGPHKDKLVYANWIDQHPTSEKAANIGRARMKKFCIAAVGTSKVSSGQVLLGKPVAITLRVTEKNGQMQTDFMDIRSLAEVRAGAAKPSAHSAPAAAPAPIAASVAPIQEPLNLDDIPF